MKKPNHVSITKSDFLKEHKHLVAMLSNPRTAKPELREEAKEQAAEVKKLAGVKLPTRKGGK